MDIAYDKFLNDKVKASEIINVDNKSNRYRCLYCDEDLTLVLPRKSNYSAYFRHKKGNNDKDCDEYYKTTGMNSKYYLPDSENNKSVEFFFNRYFNNFELGIFFETTEIEELYKNNATITIKANDKFIMDNQIISRIGIIKDSFNYFKIDNIFEDYIFHIGERYRKIKGVNQENKILFFKVKDNCNHAKIVNKKNGNLYIDSEYIIISRNKKIIEGFLRVLDDCNYQDILEFNKCGNIFYTSLFKFKNINEYLTRFLKSYEYNLISREYINILWPPTFEEDEKIISTSDNIYLDSSFLLKKNVNTNSSVEIIKHNDPGIFKLNIEDILLISKKNIDLKIVRNKEDKEKIFFKEIIKKEAKVCKITYNYSDNDYIVEKNGNLILSYYDYYFFNKKGYKKLFPGEKVELKAGDRIIGYEKRHKRVEITPYIINKEVQDKLMDALRYYPKSEPYIEEDYKRYDYCESIEEYLLYCKKCGMINSIIKKYIEEGLL